MQNTYVQALLELLESHNDTQAVIDGFSRVLTERGHEALARPVLTGVLRVLESKQPDTVVVTASQSAYQEQEAVIKQHLTNLGADSAFIHTTVDPTVVGGYAVEHNHQRVDATYKTTLINLYQSITNQ